MNKEAEMSLPQMNQMANIFTVNIVNGNLRQVDSNLLIILFSHCNCTHSQMQKYLTSSKPSSPIPFLKGNC